MEDYYYFIHNNPISSDSKQPDKLPRISKVEKSIWPINAYYSNPSEAEGPFESLLELKKRSLILAGVKLEKHRQRVLKSNNIIKTKGFILTEENDSFTFDFMNAFAHITIGKITNSKVKGIHFYNPNTIRIIEKKHIDSKTNCYSARIEKLNQQTGLWIEKESESTFFPDNWSLHKLFHEFNYAYSNKIRVEGNIYHSRTTEGFKVKFIINQDDKILTCYPIIDNE